MENILESFNSVSEYNIDASTFEAQIYLLLSDDREKDTTSMNEKRDAIPSDWDTGLAPTDWGLSPPPPPGSWGNTVYHSVYSTQNTNALPIPTISASSSTYNTSPTIDSSTLVIYKSRIRHRTRHKTKQQNQTSTIGSAPTAASCKLNQC
jgi:hypothetical protein